MMFSSFFLLLLIGLAGSLGAVARYLIARFFAEKISVKFPLGTLFINITGAFVIALLFALSSRHLISSEVQTTLATGFLGGYTTFSTMSWEGVQLARGRTYVLGLCYLMGSIVLGLIAAVLGLSLGRWL